MLSRTLPISVLLMSSLLLTSCDLFSGRRPDPEILIVQTPELGCPTALLGEIIGEEPLPDTAGFVRPETEVERSATESLLLYMQRNQVWGREGWDRAGAAKRYCDELAARQAARVAPE